MTYVKAKKNLGQHFLKDQNIARKIVSSLRAEGIDHVLEIGPGMGVLTRYLLENETFTTHVVEIDTESVDYLEINFPDLKGRIISGDFLQLNLSELFEGSFAVIGNFPYNISSQIFFKILENRNRIPESVGMIQKEVAERIAAPPGSKTYGILSVLLQAFYKIEYLFTVSEHVFAPPPKVKSAVIRLTRNQTATLDCDEKLFFNVVKTAFNQRRKTLNNSLKGLMKAHEPNEMLQKRPEQLSVKEFVELTKWISGL
ncbi:MAG: 16S rRNA (adenine(1518)-N(6)/adenine(1519)-N(6))-dimethyltransferase RsmA [Bacteroidota bacterium]|nr:16S rRNA (adenine(1518)-N(6)/adenine(1519)-N(6))-dimethyltransferase RsmA [Bacteroidota bacterium]